MKIHYLSGSRADFGLMQRCLIHLKDTGRHEVGIVVTGQHTIAKYGETANEIHNSPLDVIYKIPVMLTGEGGGEMALALAAELAGLTDLWQRDRPDLVIVLGDRGEMLAGALAAVHLGIHVAHIHGGERSGTLDESMRHAISKLAHVHFPATAQGRDRLIAMGEVADTITVIGAPGLVGVDTSRRDKSAICGDFGVPVDRPLALCIFHPVVQEATRARAQIEAIADTLKTTGYTIIMLRPNSDAGGREIDAYLDTQTDTRNVRVVTHLNRTDYLDILSASDLLIGNSSSGIIESASFGIPCVNIGSRQNHRERNANTFDCADINTASIKAAISAARNWSPEIANVYGDGTADKKLAAALDSIKLCDSLLNKCNTY